jgi:glycosyltransferase 2 family protein
MSEPGPRSVADLPGGRGRATTVRRLRAVAGVTLIVLAVGAASYAAYRDRASFIATFHRVGVGPVALSLLFGLVGTGLTFPIWRTVLGGLDVRIPWRSAARVFFVSQLGKYVPGSIWPVVMQMEAGHARGANRRTMLAANLITIVTTCAVGLIIASVLLPSFDTGAFHHYWWVLLAVPVLVALLHPRAITGLIDRVFGLFGRPPLGESLPPRAAVSAAGWSVAMWIALGAQLAVLGIAAGPRQLSTWLLCTGAMALAVSAGVLFIPAPAGAGIRDVILVLVLGAILPPGPALAIVLTSRGVLICCDLILAGVAAVIGSRTTAEAANRLDGRRADRTATPVSRPT